MKRFSWLLIVALLLAIPVIGVASQGDAPQVTVGELICGDASEDLVTGGLLTIGSPLLGANCDNAGSGGGYGTMGVEYPDGRWRIR